MADLTDEQYQVLLIFRTALRRYLAWSAESAAEHGLTAQQSQLLLAVRAHPNATPPSIRELAGYLLIRHHSVVGLANRVEAAGLVRRFADEQDQRVVRLQLTDRGRSLIAELSDAHLAELQRVAERLHISEEFLDQLAREFSNFLVHEGHGLSGSGL